MVKVGLVANSNPTGALKELEALLNNMGLDPQSAPFIDEWIDDHKKAKILNDMYEDQEIKMIFDVSGGDLANGIIDYLDYTIIKNNPKPFFGYSDLTCVINAIYTKTGNMSFLYQIRNIQDPKQHTDFKETILNHQDDLFTFNYHFIQGDHLEGIAIGGNIRCLLKLAGTSYFPDMKDKILFIESLGGESERIYSYLVQLRMLGVFDEIAGIILGTFTMMEKKNCQPDIEDLIKRMTDKPIVRTYEIGHGIHSKALIIGGYYCLGNKE